MKIRQLRPGQPGGIRLFPPFRGSPSLMVLLQMINEENGPKKNGSMNKIDFQGVFSYRFKKPNKRRLFNRDFVEADGFQTYPQKNDAEPGIEGNIVHGNDTYPLRNMKKRGVKDKIGNQKQEED
jgi:hypothetical protein